MQTLSVTGSLPTKVVRIAETTGESDRDILDFALSAARETRKSIHGHVIVHILGVYSRRMSTVKLFTD